MRGGNAKAKAGCWMNCGKIHTNTPHSRQVSSEIMGRADLQVCLLISTQNRRRSVRRKQIKKCRHLIDDSSNFAAWPQQCIPKICCEERTSHPCDEGELRLPEMFYLFQRCHEARRSRAVCLPIFCTFRGAHAPRRCLG